MKRLHAIMLLMLAVTSACAPAAQTTLGDRPGWHRYGNAKYGYEIQYPEGYDLWETDIEGERDGASIRIGLHEYQAPAPMLDIKIEPRTAQTGFPTLGTLVKDLRVELRDVSLNGMPAKEADYIWEPNDQLAFAEIYLDGLIFRFEAGANMPDFHGTEWWEIISTFRFTGP